MGVDLVAAQHTVEFGPQALDGAAALVVEKMRAELHRDAVEVLKGVGQQQALGFGVKRCALHALAVPGGADFDAAVGRVDVHVSGHAHRLARAGEDDSKRAHAALGLQVQAACDFTRHGFGPWDGGVPVVPKFTILNRQDQVVVVCVRQGQELHMLAQKRNGSDPRAHDGVSLSLAFCLLRQ